ncbi:hypothetical protein FKW77_007587 [Venturia effusa]|uniref:BTB domain-containing protein n=1 Tax=Venturia effusa TaxID=50376 RepID=A0A517LJ90_9PEZI|nr:hypothetical protein FKW77_007587 [Venturia effusa]
MAEPRAKRPKLENTTVGRKVICDSEGDVILVVGADDSESDQVSIRVSSKVLSVSSKVFKAMFGRNFKEGNELAKSSTPYQIPLPDDDPDAMAILCRILHHNADDVFLPDDAAQVMQFVAALDKYDCMKSAKFFLVVWLEKIRSPPFRHLAILLAISYDIRDETGFRRFSSKLLRDPNGVKALHSYQRTAPSFPIAICDDIAERRSQLELWLIEKLMEPITKTVVLRDEDYTEWEFQQNEHPNCEEANLVMEYIRELKFNGLWPVQPRQWNFDHTLRFDMKSFSKSESVSGCCTSCCRGLEDHIKLVAHELECKLHKGMDPNFV